MSTLGVGEIYAMSFFAAAAKFFIVRADVGIVSLGQRSEYECTSFDVIVKTILLSKSLLAERYFGTDKTIFRNNISFVD